MSSLTHHATLLSLFPPAHDDEDEQQQQHDPEDNSQHHVEGLAAGLGACLLRVNPVPPVWGIAGLLDTGFVRGRHIPCVGLVSYWLDRECFGRFGQS